MKHIVKSILLLMSVCMLTLSCSKEAQLRKSIAGTTWWNEHSVNYGTMHTEFTFTGSSFTEVITFPFTPQYPASHTTGSYTYEYPNIYLDCKDYKDVAVMADDMQSFRVGSYTFVRK